MWRNWTHAKAIVSETPSAQKVGSPITPQISVGGIELADGVGCEGMLRSAAGPSSGAAQMTVRDRESPGETTGKEEMTEPVTSVEGQATSREIACQTSQDMHLLPGRTDSTSVTTTGREMTAKTNGGFLRKTNGRNVEGEATIKKSANPGMNRKTD